MNACNGKNKKILEFTIAFFTYTATVYALSDLHILHLRKEV